MAQKKECNSINVTSRENLVKVCQITNSINIHTFVSCYNNNNYYNNNHTDDDDVIILITFTHGIYNYIPETSNISIAAVLYVQSVLHVMLFHPGNMFYTFTSTFSVVCVHCPLRSVTTISLRLLKRRGINLVLSPIFPVQENIKADRLWSASGTPSASL
jgi:hypothetical protein